MISTQILFGVNKGEDLYTNKKKYATKYMDLSLINKRKLSIGAR